MERTAEYLTVPSCDGPDIVPNLRATWRKAAEWSGYDILARLPASLWFLFLTLREILSFNALLSATSSVNATAAMTLAARFSVVLFLATVTLFFMIRTRPIARSAGLARRVVALAGTFLPTATFFFPHVPMPLLQSTMSLGFILLGNAFAIYSVLHLGRSLSIMADARRLVMSGPYRLVRHPLYAAEEIVVMGVFLQFFSLGAFFLLAAHFMFQLWRMHNEEEILDANFPEYRRYAIRHPRLIPGIY